MRFLTQRITGVQRFAFSICQELDKLAKNSLSLPMVGLLPKQKINPQYLGYLFKNIQIKQVGKLKGHLWEQFELPWFSRQNLLLNLCNTAPLIKFRQLITLHDAIFMTNLDSQKLWFKLWYRYLAKISSTNSHKVFTVSEFSKKELNRLLGIKLDKICVLGNAASINQYSYDDTILEKLSLVSKHFFLIIGSNSRRKNTQMITRLFASESSLQQNILVVVGGQFSNLGHVNHIQAANIIYADYVEDSALRSLYHHAKALIFPSIYEGFGIPVLEAMSESTPVIASNIPVLHEVCGNNGALYFDPNCPLEVVLAIQKLNDNKFKSQFIKNGLVRASAYSWRKFAQQIFTELISFQ